MPQLLISAVAQRFGMRASAIRYYEQIRILPPPQRVSGQRRYDTTMLRRLALIHRARQLGFSLEEIRELFCGFESGTPASRRWRELSRRKLAQLEQAIERIRLMRQLLERMARCGCAELDECGAAILADVMATGAGCTAQSPRARSSRK